MKTLQRTRNAYDGIVLACALVAFIAHNFYLSLALAFAVTVVRIIEWTRATPEEKVRLKSKMTGWNLVLFIGIILAAILMPLLMKMS